MFVCCCGGPLGGVNDYLAHYNWGAEMVGRVFGADLPSGGGNAGRQRVIIRLAENGAHRQFVTWLVYQRLPVRIKAG